MIMKIVFFNGGLANQVYQYIFYRFCQIRHPEEDWLLDDSAFFLQNVHNGYELETLFGVHPRLLSRSFDPDVWEYMIQLKKEQHTSIPQILLDNGNSIKMVVESTNWEEWNPFRGVVLGSDSGKMNPAIADFTDEIYYHGYWITADWFRANEDIMRKELQFPEIDEPNNIDMLKRIRETESCSLHVRRGDYVSIGISMQDVIYQRFITCMLECIPDMTLFVFSDDAEYCKNHMHEMGLDLPKEVIFVEGNNGRKAYRDLQLMSHCKNMINGNSAFCYLAAMLNQNLNNFISPPNRKL